MPFCYLFLTETNDCPSGRLGEVYQKGDHHPGWGVVTVGSYPLGCFQEQGKSSRYSQENLGKCE